MVAHGEYAREEHERDGPVDGGDGALLGRRAHPHEGVAQRALQEERPLVRVRVRVRVRVGFRVRVRVRVRVSPNPNPPGGARQTRSKLACAFGEGWGGGVGGAAWWHGVGGSPHSR